ncbi:PH domain-containing protein [Emticicia fontis]
MKEKILLMKDEKEIYRTGYHWVQYLSFAGLSTLFVIPLTRHFLDHFLVTNKRVIAERSMPVRSLEIWLNRVRSMEVKQHQMGRLLGFGTIIITSTGGKSDHLFYIKDPHLFYEAYERARAASKMK